ncbi:MAG TPA: hypothetical protein VF952_00810 [Chloroflexia bacterium]|jgi:hypothetical protein
MGRLTYEEQLGRLRMDYRVASELNNAAVSVEAYRSPEDLKQRQNPITDEADGHLAAHYLVHYHIKTLAGVGEFSSLTVVHYDLLANGNYPYSVPGCWVISEPMPWSPHFRVGAPVCVGEIWEEAKGKILLGHLILHVARLLNFDEVARGGGYVGWNAEAIHYWREQLQLQPITPSLVLPPMPLDKTHGLTFSKAMPGFKAKGSTASATNAGGAGFKPRGQIGGSGTFNGARGFARRTGGH